MSLAISASNNVPKTHFEAFAEGAYTFTKDTPLIDKITVIANYILSIIFPLYPIVVFTACWLVDAVSPSKQKTPQLDEIFDFESNPPSAATSIEEINQPNEQRAILLPENRIKDAGTDPEVMEIKTESVESIELIELLNIANPRQAYSDTTKLMHALAQGGIGDLMGLQQKDKTNTSIQSRLDSNVPPLTMLALALSTDANRDNFLTLMKGRTVVFNNLKQKFIDGIDQKRTKMGEAKWKESMENFCSYASLEKDFLPSTVSTADLLHRIRDNIKTLYPGISKNVQTYLRSVK